MDVANGARLTIDVEVKLLKRFTTKMEEVPRQKLSIHSLVD